MTDKAREDLADICRIISETVEAEQIYLFGSHAYGAPDADSGYDLCVVIRDGSLRPTEAIKRIRRALYPVQDTPLDVVVYSTGKFLQRKDAPALERGIARDGALLYNRTGLEQRMG